MCDYSPISLQEAFFKMSKNQQTSNIWNLVGFSQISTLIYNFLLFIAKMKALYLPFDRYKSILFHNYFLLYIDYQMFGQFQQ